MDSLQCYRQWTLCMSGGTHNLQHTIYDGTVGQNNQEYRFEYWATRSSVHSFAQTTDSFAGSALLASRARSAALIRSLAPHYSLAHSLLSLTPELVGQGMIGWLFCLSLFSIFEHSETWLFFFFATKSQYIGLSLLPPHVLEGLLVESYSMEDDQMPRVVQWLGGPDDSHTRYFQVILLWHRCCSFTDRL